MDTSDDKGMLMRKLAICELGCRNILYLMFESLSIYCLYQKRLVETICCSEIEKAKHSIEKCKAEKEKPKKKEVWVKHQCRNDRWWRDIWSPQSTFDLWKKKIRISWEEIIEHHYLKILRALSKSSTRSSDHLNLVSESVPAAATCLFVLLAILFFI